MCTQDGSGRAVVEGGGVERMLEKIDIVHHAVIGEDEAEVYSKEIH